MKKNRGRGHKQNEIKLDFKQNNNFISAERERARGEIKKERGSARCLQINGGFQKG